MRYMRLMMRDDLTMMAPTDDGLKLETCTVTDDLYQARNTLTMRTVGGLPTGIVHLDVSNMADGDRAGIAEALGGHIG